MAAICLLHKSTIIEFNANARELNQSRLNIFCLLICVVWGSLTKEVPMQDKHWRRKVVIVVVLVAMLPIFFRVSPARAGGRTVDGNPSDWTGTAPSVAHTDAESNGEWIYKGAADDCRTDPPGTDESNADITEVRLTTDGTSLYFLFRLKDVTDVNKVNVAVTIDTDQNSTDNERSWIGDDADGLTLGRQFMRWERIINFHGIGGLGQVELYADDGSSWYAPPSGYQINISTANDVLEARVPLSDLGLNANLDFVMTGVSFVGNNTWNNSGDSTYDISGSHDAVDVMSTPGQTGNAWGRDLNDGNVYFGWWIQLRGSTEAPTAVAWDRLYHSACDQLKAYNCPAKDHPVEQYVPSAGQSVRFLSARRYSTDGTVAPGGVTDVYVFDDESADAYFMAHQNDLTDDSTYPRLRYYYSSEQFVDAAKVDTWTGTWNGTTEITYDIFKATLPAQNPGNVYYTFIARDESGDRYLCRSGFGSGPENRGWTKQWVRDGQCTNTDYAYTVIDDDITGPTIENVTFTDNGSNAQVCATVYDTNTRSGDNDSGVQSVQVRYSATRADVANGTGGTTAAMSNSSGNTYCVNGLNFTNPTYYRVEATNNDYDNSRAADRESSASSTYCTGGSCAGGAGASQNNDVWWNEVYHDTRAAYYRTPFGAVPTGQSIQIRLRAAQNDLTAATLVVYNAVSGTQWLVENTPESSDGTYSYYKFTIPSQSSARILYYKFRLTDGTDCDWYVDNYAHNAYDHEDRYENGTGMMVTGKAGDPCSDSADGYANNAFNITIYNQSAYTTHLSDWAKNAVIYQIMPDRFRDGNPDNVDDWPYTDVYGTPQHIHSTWNEAVDDPRVAGAYYQKWSADFFGGDLQGIIDELDYLKAQGVTALYLNPIFASPSNHGYDTSDYLKINPRYGTNALFQTLATEAESRGIKIILDGVFNHTGSDSRYFDRYNRWDTDGNASTSANTSGACEAQASTYNDLYTFKASTTGPCSGRTDGNQQYDSWWGYDTLPLLNENAAVKNLVFDHSNDNTPANHVIQYWYSQGADGWRFDVADEVSHSFWQDFRARVKNDDNLNGPLYSEVWFEATPWLFGDQLDATMNYRYRKAVLGFLIDSTWTDNDNNGDQTMWALSPSAFDYVLNSIREDYPAEAWYAMMNLMDSHDTNRALFVLREKSDNLTVAIAKMKLMAALQFTYPGAPTLYYGNEVGLGARDYGGYGTWGAGKTVGGITQDDPYNRAPYPWADANGSLPSGLPNTGLRDVYRILALTRNNYDVLRSGDVTTLAANDTTKVYAYARTDATDDKSPTCAIAIFNRAESANSVTLSGLPTACSGTVEDVLNGGADYTISGGSLTVNNLPALTAAVLVPAFDNPHTTDTITSLPPVSVSAESVAANLANSGSTAINATVRDVAGQTLPAGVTVNFEIVSGGGALSSATATTDGSGVASVTYNAPSSGSSTVVIRATITAPSGVVYSGETTVFVGYQATVVARATSLATIGPYTLDQSGQAQVNLWARKEGRGEPVLTLARYDKNPRSGKTDTGNTYYDVHLSSTTNIDALTVRFHYYADTNENSNKLYWYNAGWTEVTGAILNTGGTGGYLEFTFTSTSSPGLGALVGGEFGAGGGTPSEPTAVTLAAFAAASHNDGILVTWETAAELDNVGFNLYRGATADGPYTRLNATLIPPQNPGSVLGAVYEWTDASITPGVVYYYKLEDLDVKGVSTFHGPIGVTLVAAPNTLVLRGLRGWSAWGISGLGLAVLALWGWGLRVSKRR